MIIVRNIFRIKFGKTKEATALWKQGLAIAQKMGMHKNARILTDVAGVPFYTLILEVPTESLTSFENEAKQIMGNAEWRGFYEKLTPLVDSGHREILRTVD